MGIIPARGGSKSIPRKNIKLLAGKPLLYYMLKAALGSKLLTNVVVSSEDDEILGVAKKYGGQEVLLKRPAKWAQDKSPDIPVLQHAVRVVEKRLGVTFDIVVMLHATSPLTRPEDIDACVDKLIKTGAESVVSVYRVNDFHPKKLKKLKGDRLLPYLPDLEEKTTSRRQDVAPVYKRNVAIYASTRNVIMNLGRVWGDDCRAYVMPEELSIDINSAYDFFVAEMLMKRLGRGVEL